MYAPKFKDGELVFVYGIWAANHFGEAAIVLRSYGSSTQGFYYDLNFSLAGEEVVRDVPEIVLTDNLDEVARSRVSAMHLRFGFNRDFLDIVPPPIAFS